MKKSRILLSMLIAIGLIFTWVPEVQAQADIQCSMLLVGSQGEADDVLFAKSKDTKFFVTNNSGARASVYLQGPRTYTFIVPQIPRNSTYIIVPGRYKYTIKTRCETYTGTFEIKTRAKAKLYCHSKTKNKK